MLALNTRKGLQHSRSVLLYHPHAIAFLSLCVPKLKIECKGLSFQRNSGPALLLVVTINKIEKLKFRVLIKGHLQPVCIAVVHFTEIICCNTETRTF